MTNSTSILIKNERLEWVFMSKEIKEPSIMLATRYLMLVLEECSRLLSLLLLPV